MKILSALLALTVLMAPLSARADSESLSRFGKKTIVVGKAAMYGTAGGLIVGLASQAFKRSTKNIFLFGSLGLYTGIGIGLYAVLSSRGGTPYEGPDTYEDYMSDLTIPAKMQEAKFQESLKDSKISLYSVNF